MDKNKVKDHIYSKGFTIVFWGTDVDSTEDLEKSQFDELLLKHTPDKKVEDKDILRYYWDEQLIEIDYKSIDGRPGYPVSISGKFFSLVLNNKIVFHGLNKTGLLLRVARKQEYDDSNYPAMISFRCTNDKNAILALKPKFLPRSSIFRMYSEQDQRRILHPEVLKHFEKQGKIIRGTIDLRGLLKDYDTLKDYVKRDALKFLS
jgi:hypothetical protein